MKRILSLFLSLIFCITVLSGCGTDIKKDKLKIVTTYFSAYDWTKNILGDAYKNTELILLSDNGVDMHSYQPTADDIINIKTADIVIYTGGSSDKWVEDALDKNNANAINSIKILKDLLLYSGDDSHDHHGHTHSEDGADEHIWLSLKNAILLCQHITDAISKTDKENADLYNNNLNEYTEKLNSLDTEFTKKFSITKNKTLIFADRFPFRYAVADYSLEYISLFEGCSSDSDATVDAILSLSKKIDETNAKYIFIIDKSLEKTAKSVIENSNSKNTAILKLNSMQSITEKELENTDYLTVIKENLDKFYKALT